MFYGASDVGIETTAAAALTVTRECAQLHFWTIRRRRRRINYTGMVPQLEQFKPVY